jgi:hypothetical protein
VIRVFRTDRERTPGNDDGGSAVSVSGKRFPAIARVITRCMNIAARRQAPLQIRKSSREEISRYRGSKSGKLLVFWATVLRKNYSESLLV